jgi:hypothetical protein
MDFSMNTSKASASYCTRTTNQGKTWWPAQ